MQHANWPQVSHLFNLFSVALYFGLTLDTFVGTSNSSAASKQSLVKSPVTASASNCTQNVDQCSSKLNLTCNPTSGRCQCLPDTPVRLSKEIPCLASKGLSEVCMHSKECNSVPNTACIASILFPIELASIPTYKEWYIYNKIAESQELNYLLHKMYGRCHCKTGYRANQDRRCISVSRDIPANCSVSTDCVHEHSDCHLTSQRCRCANGFHYDPSDDKCIEASASYRQFCVTSADCFSKETNMECAKFKCVCSPEYQYNDTSGCVPKPLCESGQVWNQTANNYVCGPPQLSFSFSSLMLKLFPILVIKLIICNLIRFVCYTKGQRVADSSQPNDRLDSAADADNCYELLRQRGQTRSLLSLPPYESIFVDRNDSQEHLPSYHEAVDLLKAGDDRNGDNDTESNKIVMIVDDYNNDGQITSASSIRANVNSSLGTN